MTAPAPRPSADEVVQELSSEQRSLMRDRAKNDLFFLARGILGYKQVNRHTHGALCNFMVHSPAKRRAVLMPRGHLKTTLCTIADSIRLALIDPENTRVLIQNEVFENASDMLTEICAHWTNERGLLARLFPELVPQRTAGTGADWSRRSASLPPRLGKKDSTWTASGSNGSPQSKHFTHLKGDDLVGEKHKESRADMERALRWTDSMEGLLDRLDDQIDLYGTRKTIGDIYDHVINDLYPNEIEVFVREPIENGQPIFPEKYPLHRLLNIMRTKPEVWAHDFMNNPIGRGGIDWGPDLAKEFSIDYERRCVWLKSHKSDLTVIWAFHELDVVVLYDPNKGNRLSPDKAAIQAHGVTPEDQILVLEAKSDRWPPDVALDQCWQMCQRWNPRVVGIEDQGNATAVFWFMKRCAEEQWYYRVEALQHTRASKEVRIRNMLDTPLRAGRIYLQRDQMTLASAISFFPQLAPHNWDELDCMSFGPEVYRTGVSTKEIEQEEEAETRVLEFRGVTGYGESV